MNIKEESNDDTPIPPQVGQTRSLLRMNSLPSPLKMLTRLTVQTWR